MFGNSKFLYWSVYPRKVVPIILAIALRSIEQFLGEERIRTGTYNLYVILGYKFSSSCE